MRILIHGFRSVLLATVLLTAATIAGAAEDKFSLSTGVHYGTGDYGSTFTTKILYVPLTGKYETGDWAFKLTVPYLRIEGPGNVVPDLGGVGVPGVATTTEDGMGDITGSVAYRVYNNKESRTSVKLTGKFKAPTADEDRGLGSGEADFAGQVGASKGIGKNTVFGDVGYKFYGDPPGRDLNNVWYFGIGDAYQFTDKTSAGLVGRFKQKVSDTGENQRTLTGFVSHKLDKTWSTQVYAIRGFSDSNADWSGGLMVKYTF